MPLINFSGLASGIDSESLIDAIGEATRAARVNPKEDKISDLEDENAALEELNSQLSTIQGLVRGFSTIGGGAVSKLGTSTDETVVTATASNTAAIGSYTLNVTQRAENAVYSFGSVNRTYTSTTDIINPDIVNGNPSTDRDIVIDVGTGSNLVQVTTVLTDTTTISDMVNDLNDQFNANGNVASAVAVNIGSTSSPDYRIMIVTAFEGTEKGSLSVDIAPHIQTAGLPTGGAFDDNGSDPALDAEFTMNGISGTITRGSNTVADLIPGVTFNLESTGTATVTVEVDVASTTATIQEFIDAFNDMVTFARENSTIVREEDGEDVNNVFGPLARSRIDENVISALRTDMIGSAIDNTNNAIAIFSDFGITTERDGTLKFDEQVLEEALQKSPDSVSDILQNFGDAAGITSGTIDQYIRFNGLIDTTTTGNSTQVTNLNESIARAEALIARNADALRQRFARLESQISQLQSQQQSLLSVLGAG